MFLMPQGSVQGPVRTPCKHCHRIHVTASAYWQQSEVFSMQQCVSVI